jgi:hypothetical protein
MDSEIKEALSGIKSAWKNMLTARDKETYNFWSEEQLRLQKILYDERKKTLQRLRTNPTGESKLKRGPGRPRKTNTEAERRLKLQMYQHEYYLRVTKAKRAERRKK